MITVGATHDLRPDPAVQAYLARQGGSNLYGAPRFRIVWSGNRTTLSNRKWTEAATASRALKTTYGWRRTLKYKEPSRHERFIIEMYRPPEFYGTPELWAARYEKYVDGELICPAGPFPRQGDYDYVDTVESIDDHGVRHFLSPTNAYVDMVLILQRALVETSEHTIESNQEDKRLAKREADRNYILEKIKNETSPFAFGAHAAITNTDALRGSADYLARNAAVPTIQ